jgi:uncharacterized protein YxeA
MSKKFILISLALIVIIILIIGSFFVMQNFNKPNATNLSTSTSSSSTEEQNPEVKNPFIKNNQSEDVYSENTSSETIAAISEKSISTNTSKVKSENTFTELKKLPDNSTVYDLKGFDPDKLQGEPLIDLVNYFPNKQNPPSLFIEKDSKKRFLGYGAVNSFQFEIKNKKYNLTVFEDETGYPSPILTNEDYSDPKNIYVGFDYASGRFTQKANSSKFIFDGTPDNGEIVKAINKTFDVQDVYDFDPKE